MRPHRRAYVASRQHDKRRPNSNPPNNFGLVSPKTHQATQHDTRQRRRGREPFATGSVPRQQAPQWQKAPDPLHVPTPVAPAQSREAHAGRNRSRTSQSAFGDFCTRMLASENPKVPPVFPAHFIRNNRETTAQTRRDPREVERLLDRFDGAPRARTPIQKSKENLSRNPPAERSASGVDALQ